MDVALQKTSSERGNDDGFGSQGHLETLDEVYGHQEEGDFEDDVKCANDFPSSELTM